MPKKAKKKEAIPEVETAAPEQPCAPSPAADTSSQEPGDGTAPTMSKAQKKKLKDAKKVHEMAQGAVGAAIPEPGAAPTSTAPIAVPTVGPTQAAPVQASPIQPAKKKGAIPEVETAAPEQPSAPSPAADTSSQEPGDGTAPTMSKAQKKKLKDAKKVHEMAQGAVGAAIPEPGAAPTSTAPIAVPTVGPTQAAPVQASPIQPAKKKGAIPEVETAAPEQPSAPSPAADTSSQEPGDGPAPTMSKAQKKKLKDAKKVHEMAQGAVGAAIPEPGAAPTSTAPIAVPTVGPTQAAPAQASPIQPAKKITAIPVEQLSALSLSSQEPDDGNAPPLSKSQKKKMKDARKAQETTPGTVGQSTAQPGAASLAGGKPLPKKTAQMQPDPPSQPGQSRQQPAPTQSSPVSTSPSPSAASYGSGSSVTTARNFRIPLRSKGNKPSTVGRPIIVETNYLEITLPKVSKKGEHYDVTIEPDKPKAMLFQIVQKYLATFFPKCFPAFDGVKNLYSYGPLLKTGVTTHSGTVVFENTKNKNYKVTIKLVSSVDFSSLTKYMEAGTSILAPQEAMQCLDVVLRHSPQMRFIKVGRSFFTPPDEKYDLGGGMELWYGFFQSAVLGWKPYINVDIAHKGFPIEQNVIQYYLSVSGSGGTIDYPMQRWHAETINKYMKGMKVRLTFDPSRSYRVNEAVTSARLAKFKGPNDRMMTVEEYFKAHKNIVLKYPNAPCLWVGSRDSKVYMPAELCVIVGNQVCNKRLNEMQVAAMIKKAATKPDIRKRKIQEKIRNIAYNKDPVVRDYGVSVADSFSKVPARILNPPRLQYNDTIIEPRNGEWRSGKFSKSMELTEWMMVCLKFANRGVEMPTMAETFMAVGRNLGMRIDRPKQMLTEQRVEDLGRIFHEAKLSKKQLVMVIVPGQGGEYAKVKQLAELQVGILTQCLKQNTASRLNQSCASNLLLKINAKLTGLNQVLDQKTVPACLKKPCMIVGADVTHPSPDQQTTPSFAAVAASFEKNCFKYNLTLSVQEPKKEIIQEFGDMMKEHLQFFQKNNNNILPQSIYIFRDGVSEGQFSQVLDNELSAVYRACEELQPKYKPKIMFLLVQKRHHTRFFPADKNADRNGNVLAGTIVNTEITHPTELDFYLVSHAAIQGTARPTRYHCVWNDAAMSDDDIEQLTYYLCHLYTRCTRSVSYPAPTYYAHLACTRAKILLENRNFDILSLQRKPERINPLKDIVKELPMFFV